MTPSNWLRLSLLLGIAAACLGWWNASRSDAQAPTALVGAKPVLDASRFQTLHEAFEAVSKRGGLLRIPPGEFHIERPLIVSGEDVAIVGAGTATTIINDNKKGEPAILMAHPLAKRPGGADRKHVLWRIRLADVRLIGNPESGDGVEARNINEIFLDNISVTEHGRDGVRLDHCYEDPRVSDSLITYNKATGLNLIGCHDIVVSANQFEENNDALHCTDGFNLTMSGNNLDDHLGNGVVIENTYGSVVAGNMIEECAGDAVVLDRDCYGITLSANVIAHNGGGMDLLDAHGISVSGNTFTLMKTHAVRIGPDSGRITVSGNSFCDSYIGEGKERRKVGDRQAGGVVVDGANDVGVTGNVFSGLTPHALAIGEPVNRLMFANNVVVDSTLQESPVRGAQFRDNLLPAQAASTE